MRKTIYQSQSCCNCALHSIKGNSKEMSHLSLIMFKENICVYTPNIQINKSLLITFPLFLLFLLYHLFFAFALEKIFASLFSPLLLPTSGIDVSPASFSVFCFSLYFLTFLYNHCCHHFIYVVFSFSKQYCYVFYSSYNCLCLVCQLLYLLFPTQFLYSHLSVSHSWQRQCLKHCTFLRTLCVISLLIIPVTSW